MTTGRDSIDGVAQELGFLRLRPGQREAIEAVLGGHDTLAVMPTGFGKSAIYQIAGRLTPGPTIVVSPLIALQADQVESLDDSPAGEAAESNSTISRRDRREALADLAGGDLDFLFLAPEQFGNTEVLDKIGQAKPSLFVIDEAHCVSSWGHDFRPDYLKLGTVINELGRPPVLALTATASPPVRDEIIEQLQIRDPVVLVQGFDRPNLHLSVRTYSDAEGKRQEFVQLVAEAQKPGIAYASTRRGTEEVAEALQAMGVSAAFYHGGMGAKPRTAVHNAFLDGELDVIVATTAFGMGIDKPNVRFVYHHDVADSLDSYYQEVGRAGRDGEHADATLFYRQEDLALRKFFAGGALLGFDALRSLAELIEHERKADVAGLKDVTGLSSTKLATALNGLEREEAVELSADGQVRWRRGASPEKAAAGAAEAELTHQRVEQSRVEMMHDYAETTDCRRQFLLNYFGEHYEDPCPNCDNCLAEVNVAEDRKTQPFPLNSRVQHRTFGSGLVVRYEGDDKTVVLFDEAGYKTLSVDLIVEGDILKAAGD